MCRAYGDPASKGASRARSIAASLARCGGVRPASSACSLLSRAPRARSTRASPSSVSETSTPRRSCGSEERRVGKECRSRGSPYHEKKKERKDEVELGIGDVEKQENNVCTAYGLW